MTYREKLAIEHPDMISEKWIGGCANCPADYNYGPEREGTKTCPAYLFKSVGTTCTACWDREILGTDPTEVPPVSETDAGDAPAKRPAVEVLMAAFYNTVSDAVYNYADASALYEYLCGVCDLADAMAALIAGGESDA